MYGQVILLYVERTFTLECCLLTVLVCCIIYLFNFYFNCYRVWYKVMKKLK